MLLINRYRGLVRRLFCQPPPPPPSSVADSIRIRIHRIHMFSGLLDPDPFVRGMDPDPAPIIIKQK